MKTIILRLSTLVCILGISASSTLAASYDLEKSTPVGSWQLRQETTVDDDGTASMTEVKTSLIDEEERGGVDHVWVEIETKAFRLKDGAKGKQTGDVVVVKVLLDKSILKGKAEDIFNNLRGLGKEIILQQGDSAPMKIEEGGILGNLLKETMGLEINYDFEEIGTEKIDVPAGKMKCRVVEGSGSVSMNVIFQTITVEAQSKQWISDDVPFGIVKSDSTSTMNDEVTKTTSVLLEYGKSGAVSAIKGEAQSLQIPNLKGLFGG